MMKNAILVFGVVAFALLGFVGGKMFAERQTGRQFAAAHEHLVKLNELSQYTTLLQISQTISAKNYDHALCIVDVTASVYYRELQACLADAQCRHSIEEAVKKDAPELLRGGKKFNYHETSQKCVFR